ncbi:MAG TPA: glycosyltransferase family 2 protein [Planctomycetota bacterium]|nr:glycosyltransferase family 2 protein [Planctomycetota bacterium]
MLKLSILIPVYNEKKTLPTLIERVRNAPVDIEKEIVLVDDCSTDGTRDLLSELAAAAQPGACLRVFFHEKNQGKGAAIRTALANASGDVMLIQDADLEYDPADYPALLRPILDDRADAVFSTRFLGGSHRVLYYRHYLGNRIVTAISNVFTNLNLSDIEAGYKLFRAGLLKASDIKSDRFGLEPELVAKLSRRNCRIYEVPISYNGRTYAEGKKITWRDGVAAVWWILRFNLFR